VALKGAFFPHPPSLPNGSFLNEWNPVSERIITSRVRTEFRKMSVIQCYAPTDYAKTEEKEQFYSPLDRTLINIHRSHIILVMGDFNAKVGNNNEDVEHLMGKHGLAIGSTLVFQMLA
jgi:exonuclease III